MLRILRRLLILLLVLALPLYALSFTERLEIPPAWHAIAVGDDHAQVRASLRRSGLDDGQCDWLVASGTVRCTLIGQHHASGIAIRFDGPDRAARVSEVRIHPPVYTGPFHLHVRLRRALRG